MNELLVVGSVILVGLSIHKENSFGSNPSIYMFYNLIVKVRLTVNMLLVPYREVHYRQNLNDG